MDKRGYPSEIEMTGLVEKHKRLDCKTAAAETGFSYARCRTVLEDLAESGEIKKVMRGTRRFHFEPSDIMIGGRIEVETNAGELVEELREQGFLTDDRIATVDSNDDRVWAIRANGKRLGEIAQLEVGSRVNYQIISPFNEKVYADFGAAFDVLVRGVDKRADMV